MKTIDERETQKQTKNKKKTKQRQQKTRGEKSYRERVRAK